MTLKDPWVRGAQPLQQEPASGARPTKSALGWGEAPPVDFMIQLSQDNAAVKPIGKRRLYAHRQSKGPGRIGLG